MNVSKGRQATFIKKNKIFVV